MSEIDRELARRSLHEFVQRIWPAVETDIFIDGWHIEAICEHLEAVSRGQIRRLVINMPPRHTKSLLVSVFWPAWDWLQNPQRQFLFASYAQTLSIRDSTRCRRVIIDPEYQAIMAQGVRFGNIPGFRLTGDQNTKIRFENDRHGYRLATSVDGALTGEGGHIIGIDDPHNVVEGESDTIREGTVSWFDESMSTRLNDPKTGAFVLIMQRVHERDLSGHVLKKNHPKWDHLCLPARYEGKNRIFSSIGWFDPRTEKNEPLYPDRFGDQELKELEASLTAYGVAGQLQQRPAPREGGIYKITKFIKQASFDRSLIVDSARYWDKGGTKNAGAYTAGVLIHRLKNGMYVIADVVRGQWSALEREDQILKTARQDGRKVRVFVEQEPGSGGKESAENTVRNLAGFKIRADRPVGDKTARAELLAAQVEHGNVILLMAGWTDEYVRELQLFPNGNFRDQADASAGGFNRMVKKFKMGTWGKRNKEQ